MATTKEGLELHVIEHIALARRRIESFKSDLDDGPFSALENCDSTFSDAAKLRVLTIVKAMLDRGDSVEAIVSHAMKEVMRGARHPRDSTSPTSNLAHRMLTAAWAEIAAWAGGAL